LNLFYLGDMSYEEIAQTLDLPLNTVRSRLHRAREKLQALAQQRGWT
jgi:RNA polymerase sigma-70 factor (ECF subfamily)